MFELHQKAIARYAAQSPENMADVATFVLLTIQQSLITVPNAMLDVSQNRHGSKFLWGFKTPAYLELQNNKNKIFDILYNLAAMPVCDATRQNELLSYVADLPGFGLAKGGFFVQLLFGISGCLDSHNCARFEIDPRQFKAYRYKSLKTYGKKRDMIEKYHDLCALIGGTKFMWNDWCEYVFRQNRFDYKSAFHVSELHCEALGITATN